MIYDIQWKRTIIELAEYCLQFFFPALAKESNPDGELEFLQQEFFSADEINVSSAERVDILIKIPLLGGMFTYCLLHIEAQSSPKPDFAKRMFKYYSQIFNRFDAPVVALAIITDDKERQQQNHFEVEFHGTRLQYRYNVYNINSQNIEELLTLDNPFALVIVAMLKRRHIKNEEDKFYVRTELLQLLQQRGYPKLVQNIMLNFITQLFVFKDPIREEQYMKVIGGLTPEELQREKEYVIKTKPYFFRLGAQVEREKMQEELELERKKMYEEMQKEIEKKEALQKEALLIKNREIAKELLIAKVFSLEKISYLTNISIEELQLLEKDML